MMSKQLVEDVLHTEYQVIGSGAGMMLQAWPITTKELAQYAAELRAENARFNQKIAAAEEIFSHFGGLSELSKLENGQGETAVDLIDDYLKL
jgi:hypothetical protein